jgi:(p)ppGpp synthase/HD superfamily hydrolase
VTGTITSDYYSQQMAHVAKPGSECDACFAGALSDAIYFAALKHTNQRRKDVAGSPYINHPLQVVYLLTQAGVSDVEILMAGVLHDTVEDTNTTLLEIEERFGATVAQMVAEVSDDKSLPKERRKQLQIEHVATASTGAKLIKLADKYSNLSDLMVNPPKGWSRAEIEGYAYWCLAVVRQVRGLNEWFDAQFDTLFAHYHITVESDAELQAHLERYYSNIKASE